ncbi:MAG: ORF6N domain-containing protein [Spirochaetia bacterium]|nr:ORF6N domain-containing protein [Spirochaetia bacterium]
MNDLLNIENKILVIKGQQVMLDRDLAELYGVETKVLNQAVKRNIERFPDRFMFQLNKDEAESCSRSQIVTLENLKSQIVTSSWGGRRKLPYAFTEQGVAMLASVLKSPTAIQISIKIIDAFVAMRRFLLNNTKIFTEIDSIKHHLIESDERIDTLFTLMDRYKIEDKQGVFVQGQIYDAYTKFQELIQKAQKEIILIDNYIDLTVLDQLTAKNAGVDVIVYTQHKTPIKKLDIVKFNAQYPTLKIKHTNTMHDRFLILDNSEIYHIGASLKDLGKKCFGFTRLEDAHLMIKTVLGAL